jgi:hypothetical protein
MRTTPANPSLTPIENGMNPAALSFFDASMSSAQVAGGFSGSRPASRKWSLL